MTIQLRKSLARDYALNELYARHYCFHVLKNKFVKSILFVSSLL